tara:strand:+ start:207 stop:1040 length:834 start_codon:yes stop_codon:yes gene_type:complete
MDKLKRVKELQKEIKGFEAIERSLKKQSEDLDREKEGVLLKHYRAMFSGALVEGDQVRKGYDGFGIYRVDKDTSTYSKEILSVSFNASDWRADSATKIATSFYSTSDNSEFEVRRMITIGRVGMIILDFKDDILAGYNQIKDSFKDREREIRSSIRKNGDLISECDIEIEDLRRAEVEGLLAGDGVEFLVEGTSYRNPTFEIRYNWNVRNVVKLKVLSKTPSGKSADIEVTKLVSRYNEKDEEVLEEDVCIYNKVRMTNVEGFVFDSQQTIKNTVLD